MRKASLLWIPSSDDESVLNLVSFALVLLLLAFGFDVLKLPATIAPDRPPIVQLVGFAALACLNIVMVWTVARDDYLRFSYGMPRAVATYVVVSAVCSAAFLVRGLWDGTYVIDIRRSLDPHGVAGVAIAGQFCAMAFSSTYLLKKTDTGKVRDFKRSQRLIKSFLEAMIDRQLRGSDYNKEFARVEPDMTSLLETARMARAALDPVEANYALDYAEASKRLAAEIKQVPTAAIEQRFSKYLEEEPAMLLKLVERKRP